MKLKPAAKAFKKENAKPRSRGYRARCPNCGSHKIKMNSVVPGIHNFAVCQDCGWEAVPVKL